MNSLSVLLQAATPPPQDPSALVQHLLQSIPAEQPTAATGGRGLSEDEFLTCLTRSPYPIQTMQWEHSAGGAACAAGGGAPVAGGREREGEVQTLAAAETNHTQRRALAIDARRFLHDKALLGIMPNYPLRNKLTRFVKTRRGYV